MCVQTNKMFMSRALFVLSLISFRRSPNEYIVSSNPKKELTQLGWTIQKNKN